MKKIKVPIEISARHIHLAKKDLDKLFGHGHELKEIRGLNQSGDFAAQETVEVIGKKKNFSAVRVIGPCREHSQLEISATDARALGINAPLRLSGDIKKSPGIKLKGPRGAVKIKEGVITAKRHLHANPEEAKKIKIRDGSKLSVAAGGERGLVFNNVIVRVAPEFSLSLHIDTDEANAAGIAGAGTGEILIP